MHMAAFDLVRLKSQQDGTTPPCWLCMSEEAKQQAREDLVVYFNEKTRPLTPFTEDLLRTYCGRLQGVAASLQSWQDAELHYKTLREAGNPAAFFAK